MNHMLWLDGYPILPIHHCCTSTWLMSKFGEDPDTVDENDLNPLILKALELANRPAFQRSVSMTMTPAVKLFWRTRLYPVTAPRAQLEILVPSLTFKGTPLDPRITDKIVRCSSERLT